LSVNAFQDLDLDSSALLEALRKSLDLPELDFAAAPRRLGAGGEAVIDAFRLSGARPDLSGPLVVRRLIRRGTANPRLEAALHSALVEQGFPVPRIVLAEPDPAVLGCAFTVMERLPGQALLTEVGQPGELLRSPTRLPGLVYTAALRVPRLLGELQSRLHALDVDLVRKAVRSAGVTEAELSFSGRLDQLEARLRAARLAGLEPGLEWLRRHQPAENERVVCHGDFVFTNVFLEDGRVTGVFDWSQASIAHPAYDVAGTLARLTSSVPDVPVPLRALFQAVQRRLARGYLRSYSRSRSVDPRALDFFGAYWAVAELTWSGERLRAGAQPTGRIEERWLQPQAIELGARRFRELSGIEIEPLRPGTL